VVTVAAWSESSLLAAALGLFSFDPSQPSPAARNIKALLAGNH
jgi:hypothetical protein